MLAFGSDWTVAPAVGIFPIQSLASHCRCYALQGVDKEKGTIAPGKLADQDILQMPPDQISRTKVLWTIMDGHVVYTRAE